MRIHLFVAAAVIALLGSCASADAANVIVGNPLLNTSKYAVGCGSLSPEGCTFVSLELPEIRRHRPIAGRRRHRQLEHQGGVA